MGTEAVWSTNLENSIKLLGKSPSRATRLFLLIVLLWFCIFHLTASACFSLWSRSTYCCYSIILQMLPVNHSSQQLQSLMPARLACCPDNVLIIVLAPTKTTFNLENDNVLFHLCYTKINVGEPTGKWSIEVSYSLQNLLLATQHNKY